MWPKKERKRMKRDNSATRRFLVDAGIGEGMRVLELGCGPGEVTEVLAGLVGPSGEVVAVDRHEGMLEKARERIESCELEHVRFVTGDVTQELSFVGDGLFDAVVGRRVLMYLPEPAEVLRRVAEHLREGAIVAFEETDLTMVPGRVEGMPGHDKIVGWLGQMLAKEGANQAMGLMLPQTFAEAGFRLEGIRGEAVIVGQGGQFPLSFMLKMMMPRVLALGIGSQAEAEELVTLLEEEEKGVSSVYVWSMSFCGWAVFGGA
jgi:SAM-dependent methyltransferase